MFNLKIVQNKEFMDQYNAGSEKTKHRMLNEIKLGMRTKDGTPKEAYRETLDKAYKLDKEELASGMNLTISKPVPREAIIDKTGDKEKKKAGRVKKITG